MPSCLRSAIARPGLIDGALVCVVLQREVLPPYGWIFGIILQLDNPEEGIPGLLLPLEDINQQDRQRDSHKRCHSHSDNKDHSFSRRTGHFSSLKMSYGSMA